MIKVENINVFNLAGAIEGMRFPLQSWAKSDSGYKYNPLLGDNPYTIADLNPDYNLPQYVIGPNDLALAQKLIASGADSHSKFLRQISVSMNIRAPRFWWAEMDTYKIGTTSNSESTMHTLSKKPITKECFSFDGGLDELMDKDSAEQYYVDEYGSSMFFSHIMIEMCEQLRKKFVETGDKYYWRALIQLLPSSWNQMRHWTANFQVLRKIYIDRRFHKLQEWRDFCAEIEKLPCGKELITFGVNKNDTTT